MDFGGGTKIGSAYVEVMADTTSAAQNLDKFTGKFEETAKNAEKAGKKTGSGLGAGFVGGLAASGAFLAFEKFQEVVKDTFNLVTSHQGNMVQLGQTLKSVGDGSKKAAAGAKEYLDHAERLSGVTENDMIPGFLKLISVTGGVAKAQKDNNLAMDLAARFNITLSAAQKMVGDATEGKTMRLQKYIGLVPKVTTAEDRIKKQMADQIKLHGPLNAAEKQRFDNLMKHAKTLDTTASGEAALAEAHKKSAGAAAAASHTLGGEIKTLKVEWEQLQTSIGEKVVPVLTEVTKFLLNNGGAIKTILSYAGPFLGFILAVIGAVKVWTGVQAALNIVLDANPIMLVIIALAALVTGLVYAYNHSKTFRDVVNQAFNDVKHVVGDVVSFVKGHMDTLKQIWHVVSDVAKTEFNLVGDYIHTVTNVFGDVVRAVSDIVHGRWSDALHQMGNVVHDVWNGIKSAFRDVGSDLWGPLRGMLNQGIGYINDAVGKINSFIAHIPFGPSWRVPTIGVIGGGNPNDAHGGNPQGLPQNGAHGMIVRGGRPNTDSVPAMLMPGEVVLSHRGVARLGGPDSANSLNFADGGIVPGKINKALRNERGELMHFIRKYEKAHGHDLFNEAAAIAHFTHNAHFGHGLFGKLARRDLASALRGVDASLFQSGIGGSPFKVGSFHHNFPAPKRPTGSDSTSSGHHGGGGTGGGHPHARLAMAMAKHMASLHQPYLWGGGHGSYDPNGPWDCSGAVSQVLHSAGLLPGPPEVSGQLMSWGKPGWGGNIMVNTNSLHAQMAIKGRHGNWNYFATSNSNPGGGFGRIGGFDGIVGGEHMMVRHYEKGGFVPGQGPQPAIVHGGEYIIPRNQVGSAVGGCHVYVSIQSLHPADSNTLAQIGHTVNKAIDMSSGNRLYSPIQSVGI